MIPLEKIIVLNKVPLFSRLKTEDIHMISSIATEEAYEESHILFREGDIGDKLFIIVSGTVQIIKQRDGAYIQLALLKENDFLGELALFDEETRTATARCKSACIFLVIGRTDMEQLAYEYPAIAFGFIKVLIRRMRNMISKKS
jgi:CRP/FNR family transcriptional regulator